MQAGLDVFAMDSPEHKELKEVERDLNLMEQVRHMSRYQKHTSISRLVPALMPSNDRWPSFDL